MWAINHVSPSIKRNVIESVIRCESPDTCGELSQRRLSPPYVTKHTHVQLEVAMAYVRPGAGVVTSSCPAGDSWVPVRHGDSAGFVC